ncbi:MAG: hypothetical protein MK035_03260 [Dehalococcoidia bacterium]|nr:hypothetical protein [Dehalococcoidia bacterium]
MTPPVAIAIGAENRDASHPIKNPQKGENPNVRPYTHKAMQLNSSIDDNCIIVPIVTS